MNLCCFVGHRFDNAQGRMGKKVSSKSGMESLIYTSKKEKPKKVTTDLVLKKNYDHTPHEVLDIIYLWFHL
jgi:hypothetical protein